MKISCILAKETDPNVKTIFGKYNVPISFDSKIEHAGLAVFDKHIVWYGTLPLLAFAQDSDCSIRFKSEQAAHDLLL